MTDAAGLDFDSYPSRLWFRNVSFDNLKRSLRLRDLHRAHFLRHNFSIVLFFRKTTRMLVRWIDISPGAP